MMMNDDELYSCCPFLVIIPTLAARSSQKAKRLKTAELRVKIVEELGVKRL